MGVVEKTDRHVAYCLRIPYAPLGYFNDELGYRFGERITSFIQPKLDKSKLVSTAYALAVFRTESRVL
jgi:hypothetical protein